MARQFLVNTVDMWTGGKTRPRCIICNGPTKGNKHYCSTHIEQAPRVQWIRAQLAAQESEIQAIKRKNSTSAIKKDSLTVKEIVNILHHRGPKTFAGLAKELYMDIGVVKVYARYMYQMALVSFQTNKRRSDQFIVLEITPDEETRMPSY